MVSRDLVPMAKECASRAGTGKPLDLAAGSETDARARGYVEGAHFAEGDFDVAFSRHFSHRW
jgi:hypothetical protein